MSDVPAWLTPLVDAAGRVTADDLIRHSQPPEADGRRSAVLILFGEGPDVLLIERAEQLRQHAGQPAFPGGATDPGDDGPVDTALREAEEEVGLDRGGVRVLTTLPDLFLPPTGFVVTPVLAWWERPAPVGVVDTGEVARVERVPVAELVDPANRHLVRHPSGYTGPAFDVRGMVVWGFTGGLLDRVLEMGGWAVPWDTSRVRDLPRRAVELARRGVPPGWQPPEPDDGPAADDVLPGTDAGAPGTDAEHTDGTGTVRP